MAKLVGDAGLFTGRRENRVEFLVSADPGGKIIHPPVEQVAGKEVIVGQLVAGVTFQYLLKHLIGLPGAGIIGVGQAGPDLPDHRIL